VEGGLAELVHLHLLQKRRRRLRRGSGWRGLRRGAGRFVQECLQRDRPKRRERPRWPKTAADAATWTLRVGNAPVAGQLRHHPESRLIWRRQAVGPTHRGCGRPRRGGTKAPDHATTVPQVEGRLDRRRGPQCCHPGRGRGWVNQSAAAVESATEVYDRSYTTNTP
jgi:hypothetical protein